MFSRWRKDRHYPKTQTHLYNSPYRVSVLMRALKPGVIIKLRVVGQPPLLPMLKNGSHGPLRIINAIRPRLAKTAVQRDTIQYLYLYSAFDDQPLHKIKLVHLGTSCRQIGQVPTQRRRWTTYSSTIIKGTPALKEVANGSKRRDILFAKPLQLASYSSRPKLPECAFSVLPVGVLDTLKIVVEPITANWVALLPMYTRYLHV